MKKTKKESQRFSPFRIRHLSLVRQHYIPGDCGGIPGDLQTFPADSAVQVVIFSSPAPKRVAKTVDELKMLPAEGANSSKYFFIWQPKNY